MSRPVKRSLTLNGHRTSVSIEDEFWRAFRRIATERGQPLNQLAAEIDAGRGSGNGDPQLGLATAIRLFVLTDLQARLAGKTP